MNISKITPEDPRLTAYALGELEPEEMAAIAAAIKDDPEAQAAVAQIRALSGDLTAALSHEPLPFVMPPKTVGHEPATAHEIYRPRSFSRLAYYVAGGLAAACVAAMFFVQEREVIRHDNQLALARMETENERKEMARREAANSSLYEVDLAKDEDGTHTVNMPAPTAGVAAPQPVKKQDRLDVAAAEPGDAKVAAKAEKEEVIELSPFSVVTEKDTGYRASNSIGGSRHAMLSAPGMPAVVAQAKQSAPEPKPAVNYADTSFNTEAYAHPSENDYLAVANNPLSTFSIDVDTASYANARRFINGGQRPPRDAVRIEELINYFPYHYNGPKDGKPFAASMEVASAPWNTAHRLVRIGLKGREIPESERPSLNLVFLLDVSGSMSDPNKLPLVKESMRLLVEKLKPSDRVAIVVYAGASGLALPSTPVSQKKEILSALDNLQPGGSTNGAMGIQLAYDIAKANFIKEGANRVVLCTDGDFNVGVTNQGDLTRLIEEKAKSGVFLSVLGFGMGNYKDDTLQKLADKGNGNYGYVDDFKEAKKLLVDQLSGTLVTIAKDVKIQVEFNPAKVKAYRLIGYEKRLLKAEDFNNDKIDAGEIGAGHTVTALYEVVPVGEDSSVSVPAVDPLKYQSPKSTRPEKSINTASAEMLTLKIRYKEPSGDESRKLEFPLVDRGAGFADASQDFKFAAAVAGFGMMLRDSAHKGSTTFETVLDWAESGLGSDAGGYRQEFMDLVKKARDING